MTPLVESHLPAAQASSQLRSGAVPAAGGRAEGLEEARLCTGANPKSPNEISQAPRRTQVLEQSDGFVVSSVPELKKAARVALTSKRFTLIEARINPAEYNNQM